MGCDAVPHRTHFFFPDGEAGHFVLRKEGKKDFKTWRKSAPAEEIAAGTEQFASETQVLNPDCTVTMCFSFGQYSLGTAFAYGDYEISNFQLLQFGVGSNLERPHKNLCKRQDVTV